LGANLRVGQYFNHTTSSFTGELDELRMWDTVVDFQNNPCHLMGDEKYLVGYWDFNQGKAGMNNETVDMAYDLSPSMKNADLVGFNLDGATSNWVEAKESCKVYITTDVTTSLEANNVSVYPNPVIDVIEIIGAQANSVVEIYSLTGQLIVSSNSANHIVLPSQMAQGTYIAVIKGNTTSHVAFVKE
jgi:hypothetical protein